MRGRERKRETDGGGGEKEEEDEEDSGEGGRKEREGEKRGEKQEEQTNVYLSLIFHCKHGGHGKMLHYWLYFSLICWSSLSHPPLLLSLLHPPPLSETIHPTMMMQSQRNIKGEKKLEIDTHR